MLEIQSELMQLRRRVEQLERQRARTNRGHVSQKEASEYLGCSRETLRKLALNGEGPERNPDGSYPVDGLDRYKARPR